MAAIGRIGRLWLAATVVSLSATMLVQPVAGAPVVKGDPAAWAEIVAALKKTQGTSYRAKITAGEVTTTMEFIPPNSSHTIAQTPKGPTERIDVGNASRIRYGDKWACPPAGTMPGPFLQPIWDLQGEVTATRAPDLVIDGMPTRGYAYTYTDNSQGQPFTTSYKLYVGVQTGLSRRVVTTWKGSTWAQDFYDYGAKITITLPPCS
jgi:hypothetical protein